MGEIITDFLVIYRSKIAGAHRYEIQSGSTSLFMIRALPSSRDRFTEISDEFTGIVDDGTTSDIFFAPSAAARDQNGRAIDIRDVQNSQ
jgi:hypothetical protein